MSNLSTWEGDHLTETAPFIIYNSATYVVEHHFNELAEASSALPHIEMPTHGELIAASSKDYEQALSDHRERVRIANEKRAQEKAARGDNDEFRMTDVERYKTLKRLLERPIFYSIEQAEREMRAVEGEFRKFLVRAPLGTFIVCQCSMQTNRQGEKNWTYNECFRFSHNDMRKYRDRAALNVGRELVESM